MHTKESLRVLDQKDPLAKFKLKFDLPENVLYMDGNSLGAMPKDALKRANCVITEEWGHDLIQSWNKAAWFDLPVRIGNKLGKLIGAKENETVVTDTTSINIFKALAASLNIQHKKYPQKRVIVSERSNFPTDLYMIEGLIKLLNRNYELRLIDDSLSLEQALNDDVAAVLLSHVNYRTGYLYDMQDVTNKTHSCNALVIWDLCHSVGALPIDVYSANADFAVGCTYKYLNAGPGAPAFIWVNPKHVNDFEQPLSGWWGHSTPFAMQSFYKPAEGVRRYLCGTQPIISLALVENGIDITLQAGMEQIRQKSLDLTDLFIELVNEKCAKHNLELVTPLEHKYRGSHVSLAHKEGYAIIQALIAHNVVGDYREPAVLRFGFTPLYFGYEDVFNAVNTLQNILDNKIWDNAEFAKRFAVT